MGTNSEHWEDKGTSCARETRWWRFCSSVYLGLVISRDGEVMEEVRCRIKKVFRAFGSLRCPIFNNPILWIQTKGVVYRATVLVGLMYGVEAWTLKVEHMTHLTTLHNHCVRTILGVTRYQQWEQRLTLKTLANRLRLQWLGHTCMAFMDDERMPKKMLFGELRKKEHSMEPRRGERPAIRGPAGNSVEKWLVPAVSG